jgi:Zn ribbon nucleic-acid-binding protein
MSQCIDPDWHESNLLIQLMNGGSMPRKELFNRVREEQSKKKVLGEVGITHSKSRYAYWLRNLIADQVAIESEGGPRLTPLGEWIANSQLGIVEDKYCFIYNATCPDCRKKDGYIVILKLEKGTAISDAKRRLFAKVECPRCGKKNRKRVYEGFSVDQFIRFYDQALSELASIARRMPQLVLS